MDNTANKKIAIKIWNNKIIRFILVFSLSMAIHYSVYILFAEYYVKTIEHISEYFAEKNEFRGFAEFTEIKVESKNDNIFFLFRHIAQNPKLNPMNQYSFVSINIRSHGFMPTALLISLILASPVPFKRMRLSAILGFICINLYILFKLYIYVAEHLYTYWAKTYPEILDSTYSGFVVGINSIINTQAPTGAAMAIVIATWLICTFRTNDINRLLKQ